ncbi:redoxin domain-containing protein [Pedobacter ginsengisoli]|uniref:redoxin domain-containing protein n=1 Tax=Pedobacter ginsengisoli TaxID=363852 RepID=UPI00254B39C6|nr:redoxin domain-containing protein [Pedobacter ginsengisoli]
MKRAALALLICTTLSYFADAQSYDTFKLSTEKPEHGKIIRFVYTGTNSKKLDPVLSLYYKRNTEISSIEIKGKFTGSRNEGSFRLPDSIKAFCVKANADPAEAYVFQVYKNGKPIAGSWAEAAGFYADEPYYLRPENLQKALLLYRKEFEQHPELQTDYLLRYFAAAVTKPDQAVLKDLEKTWQDSLQNGKNDQFLNDLFEVTSKYGSMPIKEGLKEKILAKYPKGTLAFNQAKAAFANTKGPFSEQQLYTLEQQFPLQVKSGALDQAYLYCAKTEFKKGEIAAGDVFFSKIQREQIKEELYVFAAATLLYSGKHLETASSYIQKALEMTKQKKYSAAGYLYTYAQIQHRLGNVNGALNSLKSSLEIWGHGPVIIETYLKYLMEAGQYDTALNVASKYVDYSSRYNPIREIILESYAKVKGTAEGAGDYYEALQKELRQRPVHSRGRLDVKSIDFTLKDTNGNLFTLSEQRGKSVVLYFFTTKHTDTRKYYVNGYFNEIAAAHQSRSDLLFVGIDNTWIPEPDKNKREKMRLENVGKYLANRDFKFKVLMDDLHYDAANWEKSYFKTADIYSLKGTSQFYIIDKKGIVRYKSFINGGDPEDSALELSRALNSIR